MIDYSKITYTEKEIKEFCSTIKPVDRSKNISGNMRRKIKSWELREQGCYKAADAVDLGYDYDYFNIRSGE